MASVLAAKTQLVQVGVMVAMATEVASVKERKGTGVAEAAAAAVSGKAAETEMALAETVMGTAKAMGVVVAATVLAAEAGSSSYGTRSALQ